MGEIVLAVVVVVLLVERVLSHREHRADLSRLLNQLEAKSAAELIALNRGERPAPMVQKDPEPQKPRAVPVGAS